MQKERSFSSKISGVVLATFIAYVIGLLNASLIGGNYFTDFRLFGVQGYEATGLLGGYIIAVITGTLLARYFAKRAYDFSDLILPTLAMMLVSFLITQITQLGEYTLFTSYFPIFFAMSLGTEQKEEKQYLLFTSCVVFVLMIIIALV